MSNLNNKLSEVLNVEPISEEINLPEIVDEKEIIEVETETVVEVDTEYARTNIRALIEKGNTAIDNILHVAKASEHPRAYEVAANFIKTMSDLNKDLLELQKARKTLEPKSLEGPKNINVDKAVFIGSTTELLKQIREMK
jgi:hypothetical protein